MNADTIAETLLPTMMVGCATTTSQQRTVDAIPISTTSNELVPKSDIHIHDNGVVERITIDNGTKKINAPPFHHQDIVVHTQHDGNTGSVSTANTDKKSISTNAQCKNQTCDSAVCDTALSSTSKPLATNASKLLNMGTTVSHQGLNSLQTHRSIITSSQFKCAQEEKPKPLVASPKQAMVLYMNKLTPYEHHEIFKYPHIYFIGANAKKRPGIVGPNNSDYDNEQGSYIHIPHDHVAYRYEVLKIIGKGSFGQVVKAYDHRNHEHVALKMVRNEKRFHRQAQEEIRILSHLRKQDESNSMNVIHMFDYFTFRNHMCITFELLYINLYELIKKNKFQGFSLQLVRKFAHSLLQCLDALAKNKIIHCDMKPENVLLKQQGRSGIKVITHFYSVFRF